MVKRIISSVLLVDLILAFVLSLTFGITQVEFDSGYYNFMLNVSQKFDDFANLRIPEIPKISYNDSGAWWAFLLNAVVLIVNILVSFANLAISVQNFIDGIVLFVIAVFNALFSIGDYVHQADSVAIMLFRI